MTRTRLFRQTRRSLAEHEFLHHSNPNPKYRVPAVTHYGELSLAPVGPRAENVVATVNHFGNRALDFLQSGGLSCAFNLANATGYSVMDVIQDAQGVTGKIIRVETAPRRAGDPPVLVGASERAHAELGWTPSRSALDVQIADAWNWMQKGLSSSDC